MNYTGCDCYDQACHGHGRSTSGRCNSRATHAFRELDARPPRLALGAGRSRVVVLPPESARSGGDGEMKIRDLRPCDNCGKPIGMIFYVLRGTMAIVKAQSVREYVGLSLMLGSGVLAEAMGGHQDSVVDLLADQKDDSGDPVGWRELL